MVDHQYMNIVALIKIQNKQQDIPAKPMHAYLFQNEWNECVIQSNYHGAMPRFQTSHLSQHRLRPIPYLKI
ncbi:hypothetical protein SDC9_108712 [bioreactor metagenome]|uniref:Uncharacterized protein n=1 Tax=bioreactor metagenome TaxID=1076179 RepID=A0A645B8P3_9ZZZZ